MSGSPPPDPPADPPQIAGRRRKRSQTPPRLPAGVAVSPSDSLEQTTLRSSTQARGGETVIATAPHFDPYPSTYPPPALYQSASSTSSANVPVSIPDFHRAQDPISPRATRKPKPHVASACVNCKKKHLRCDNNRPCVRCVHNNKADSCRDVEHKKRGRPPLKPEDSSTRRSYDPLNPLPGPHGDSLRRFPGSDPVYQPSSVYPPLRPQPNYSQRGPPFPPIYAPPSISSNQITATGTFTPSTSHYASGPAMVPGQATGGYNPTRIDYLAQSIAPYGRVPNYPPPQGHTGLSHQGQYSNPIFPRPLGPPSSSGEALAPLRESASLQLAPIRQSPLMTPIDPAISEQQNRPPSQQSSRADQVRNDGTQEPEAKRPKMDIQGILGPRDRE